MITVTQNDNSFGNAMLGGGIECGACYATGRDYHGHTCQHCNGCGRWTLAKVEAVAASNPFRAAEHLARLLGFEDDAPEVHQDAATWCSCCQHLPPSARCGQPSTAGLSREAIAALRAAALSLVEPAAGRSGCLVAPGQSLTYETPAA